MNDACCPALIDLFAIDRAPRVDEHVAGCARCQALLASETERVDVDPGAHGNWQTHDGAEAGAVVLVASPATDEYLPAVVAKVADETLTVVPVSEQIELATEWDFLLDKDVLGYDAMAEVWNFGTILPEQIAEQVVPLPEDVFAWLLQLLRAAVSSAEVPENLPVGAPVLNEDDPRLLFHDEESERVHAFWEPTLALSGAASLGQLVTHRREELAIPADQFKSLSFKRGSLEDLERDALDIMRALQPATLADLFQGLRLEWSRRLRRIAEVTIEAQKQASGYSTGTSFARRRRGTRASHEERSIGEYLDEVARHLKSAVRD
jgi:hypothetical protein